MDNFHLRWWGCGAFDVLLDDVNIAFDPYLFGENLAKAEPLYDYIFISHEHFDHCHPKTLHKLCQGARFKKLFVPIGCLTPNEPIDEKYGDAAFARDLPITKHIPADLVQVAYPHPQYRVDDERSFPGPFEFDLGPIHVEVIESGESARPDLPTCGYLVTHAEKGLSFYHTGDLGSVFPALTKLKGRVDYLIHMKTPLDKLVACVEPEFVIPTHYRTDRETEPIPAGHWPPNLTDVNAFLEDLREQVAGRAKLLPFTAPILYEVEMPQKKVKWQWEWFNSWTVPLWREG